MSSAKNHQLLHIAISVRGMVNRKDFSYLLWQVNAYRQSNNGRSLNDTIRIFNLIIWK